MKRNFIVIGAGAALVFLLSGCGIGNAPSGMSKEDAKEAIAKMTPEQKIRFIASSPMPGPEKQKKYEEIERETGVKASDVLGGSSQGSGGSGSGQTR